MQSFFEKFFFLLLLLGSLYYQEGLVFFSSNWSYEQSIELQQFNNFLAAPGAMPNLSFLTTDGTRAPCWGSMES